MHVTVVTINDMDLTVEFERYGKGSTICTCCHGKALTYEIRVAKIVEGVKNIPLSGQLGLSVVQIVQHSQSVQCPNKGCMTQMLYSNPALLRN